MTYNENAQDALDQYETVHQMAIDEINELRQELAAAREEIAELKTEAQHQATDYEALSQQLVEARRDGCSAKLESAIHGYEEPDAALSRMCKLCGKMLGKSGYFKSPLAGRICAVCYGDIYGYAELIRPSNPEQPEAQEDK